MLKCDHSSDPVQICMSEDINYFLNWNSKIFKYINLMKMNLYWNNLFCQIDLHVGKQNFRDFQTRVSATPRFIPLLPWSTLGSQLGVA